MTTIPTSYQKTPYHRWTGKHPTWMIVEACWRLYERGEREPHNGGVAAQTLADDIGHTKRSARRRCRELVNEGVFAVVWSYRPGRGPYRTYAPAHLIDRGSDYPDVGISADD